jgi:hypothetical protein
LDAPEEASAERAIRRRGWVQLIRRACEVDPLINPKCGGKMRVVFLGCWSSFRVAGFNVQNHRFLLKELGQV